MPLLPPFSYREVHGTLYSAHCQQAKRNRAAILSVLPQEILFQTLLNHYTDAIYALQTPLIYKKLTLSQRMLVVEAHEPLALRMLNDMQECGNLNGLILARLGKNHLSIAAKILKEPELCNKLRGIHFALLGHEILEVAKYIYGTDTLAQHLKEKDWALLAQNHYSLAKKILNNQALVSTFNANHLIEISKRNLQTAYDIYENETTFNKLDANIIYSTLFCHNHLKLAEGFFVEYHSILGGHLLAILGKNFESIAKTILNTPSLCSKLDSIHLSILGETIGPIGRYLLEAKVAPEKHPNLNLTDLIGPWLANLGANSIENAWYILNNKVLCSQLYGSGLAQLGKKFPEIATYIFQTDTLISQLTGEDLVELCEENPEVAQSILQTESIAQKLDEHQKKRLDHLITGGALLARLFSLDTTHQQHNSLQL